MIWRSAGEVDDLRRVDDAPDVGGDDLAILARDRDDAAIVGRLDVLAGDADVDVRDVDARPSARPFRSPLRST